jgi:hypothetical protein
MHEIKPNISCSNRERKCFYSCNSFFDRHAIKPIISIVSLTGMNEGQYARGGDGSNYLGEADTSSGGVVEVK